ncbi:hypothetical protein HCN44_002015 [Aphidius gifuensis]|uniref:Uncharacterized protein n=1 Tax=Aphidius gifuensis TaxID=684658 RepID=A0A834Y291_APHGI|nr:uncharacterized protein LOC122847354 [Aphidius gifuensis]KAF7996383.1 hypothetical protein HCN44_002015 [Aphidius gifuensis]
MSGILINPLRFVGTAKYVTNNSTKYLRSMTLTTSVNNLLPLVQSNHLNHNKFRRLQFTQAKNISTNFGTTIWAARKKILSLFSNEVIKKAAIGQLKLSLNSGKVILLTPEGMKNFIFPPTFSIEFNGKPIEPISNKIANKEEQPLAFKLNNWHVLLDDDELIFKLKDTGEKFILKHALNVEAHIYPPKPLEDGSYKFNSVTPISDVIAYPAKLISKSDGSVPLELSWPPINAAIPVNRFDSDESEQSKSLLSTEKSDKEITDKPNSFGQIKLKFPMTAFLEGARQQILLRDCDDTYDVYHTVEIQASKNLNKKKDETSKIGKLEMRLYSGDITFEPRASSKQSVIIKHSVDIEIDLDSEIPSILINPHIKTYRQ